jgi:hypothetical protein
VHPACTDVVEGAATVPDAVRDAADDAEGDREGYPGQHRGPPQRRQLLAEGTLNVLRARKGRGLVHGGEPTRCTAGDEGRAAGDLATCTALVGSTEVPDKFWCERDGAEERT